MTARAVLSVCGRLVSIQGPTWSELISVEDLPSRLRFYRALWGRGASVKGGPGPYAAFYAPMITALESVQRDLAARGVVA